MHGSLAIAGGGLSSILLYTSHMQQSGKSSKNAANGYTKYRIAEISSTYYIESSERRR